MSHSYRYVPMLYRGSFDSYAAAMASMETTDEEIVQFLEGAKAAGESVITIRWTPGPEQISPLFRVQPAPGGVSLWVGDEGYATETLEEAAAFMARTNPGAPWFASIVLVSHVGMVA